MTTSTASQILFIDSRVTNADSLLASIDSNIEIVWLSADRDGLEQIADALAGRSGVSAVHVVSHGGPGYLSLGAGIVDTASLASHVAQMDTIRAALTDTADFLLYGCNVAEGDAGAAFIDALAGASGADVAASTDATGAAVLGGDWVLEAATGSIETAALEAPAYEGILAPSNAGFESDFSGWVSSDAVIGTGAVYSAGSNQWTVNPYGSKMAVVQPAGPSGELSGVYGALQVGSAAQTYLNSRFSNPTNFGYVYTDVTLAAGETFDMAWNYVATDYSPYNDASWVSVVNRSNASDTSMSIRPGAGSAFVGGQVSILGATVTGTGNYVTGNYGSTGWQTVTIVAGEAGTYRIGFAVFNLADTILSPYLFVDQAAGTTLKNGTPYGPVPAPAVLPPPPVAPNAAPVFSGTTYSSGSNTYTDTAGNDTFLTAIGKLNATDADGNPLTFSVIGGNSSTTRSTAYGTFTITNASTGEFTYTPNNAAIQGLKSSVTDSFSITVSDGKGGSASTTVSFAINGANDTTVFGGVNSGAVQEDGIASASGTITAADRDTGDATILPTAMASIYGTFIADASGNWTYALKNTSTAVQSLNAGQTVFDTFSVTTAGGASQTVTIAVTGVNDRPTFSSSAKLLTLAEDASPTTGPTVATLFGGRFGDVDSGASLGGVLVTANAATAGQGTWLYKAVGGAWTAIPTSGLSTTHALALDADTQIKFVPALNYNGTPGVLTVYAADDQYAGGFSTSAGEVLADTGAEGVSVAGVSLSITISAVNDAPTFSPATDVAVGFAESALPDSVADLTTAAGAALSGSVAATDVENDALTFAIQGGSVVGGLSVLQGTYGKLSLNPLTGAWTYLPNKTVAINALDVGETGVDSFTLRVADPSGASATKVLAVSITGANDTPVLQAAVSDQAFAGPGEWVFQIPVSTITDAEGTGLTYAATLSNGDPLPGWLSFDPVTRTFSGNPPKSVENTDFAITITATDNHGQAVSETFTVSLGGNLNDVPTGGVTITNTTDAVRGTATLRQGDVLNAANSLVDGDGLGAVTYTWYANGVVIGNGDSLTLSQAEVGKFITVVASYTDAGGVVESVSSVKTGAVVNVNDAPTGVPTAVLAQGTEDNAYYVTQADLLKGLSDADGDTMTTGSLVVLDGNGDPVVGATVSALNPDGSYKILLPANANGTFTLAYLVSDGVASTAAAQTFTITPVNDVPAGTASAALVDGTEDQPYTVSALALLAGFSDAEYDNLSVINLKADHGSVKDNGDGTYTITPELNYNGVVSLSYSIVDSKGGAVAASQSLVLSATDDAPALTGVVTNHSVSENVALTPFTVAGLFSEVDGGTLNYTATLADGSPLPGWLSFDPLTGTFSGLPGSGDVGAIGIKVTAHDGAGGTGQATPITFVLTVDGVPTTAADAPISLQEDHSYVFTPSDFGAVDSAQLVRIDSLPGAGTLWHDGVAVIGQHDVPLADIIDGKLTYVPAQDGNGAPYATIGFALGNAAGFGASHTLTVSVAPVNDAPTATGLTDTVHYLAGATSVGIGNVVVTDVDGDTVTAVLTLATPAAGALTTGTFGDATSTYNASTGQWSVNGSVADVNAALADVRFQPVANWSADVGISTLIRDASGTGPAAGSITLTSGGGSAAVDVTVVDATNLTGTVGFTEGDASVALADIVVSDSLAGDTVTAVLTLDTPQAGVLTTGTFGAATATYNASTGIWTVSGSVDDVNAALAAVSFTPATDWNGTVHISTLVRGSAGTGPTIGTLTLTGTAQNDAPTSSNDSLTQLEDAVRVLTIADFGAYADVDGDALAGVRITTPPLAGTLEHNLGTAFAPDWQPVGSNDDISAADISAGKLRFVPSANASGAAYTTLEFQVSDGTTLSASAYTLTINVLAVNDGPALTGAQASLTAGTEDNAYSVSLADLLAGYTDAEGGTLSVVNLKANHGSVVDNGDGTYTIKPEADYNGTVTLSYDLLDGQGASTAATLQFVLNPTDDAPRLAIPLDNVVALQGTAITSFSVASHFSEADGATLNYTATLADGSPLPAWLIFNPLTGEFSGTPDDSMVGAIGVKVTAYDGAGATGASVPATFLLTVTSTPSATNDSVSTLKNTPIVLSMGDFGEYSDPQGGAEHYVIITALPTQGTLWFDGLAITAGNMANTSGLPSGTSPLPAGEVGYWVSVNDIVAGKLSFQPDTDFAGSVHLEFKVEKNPISYTSYTLAIDVADTNDAPALTSAPAVLTSVDEDVAKVVTLTELLQGYTDPEGQPLMVVGLTADHGTVTDNGNGTYTVTPALNYNGKIILSYGVSDGVNTLATDLSYNLLPVNDAPVLANPVGDKTLAAVQAGITLPSDIFTDVDGDLLNVTPTQTSGDPLPAWMSWDGTQLKLAGTPPGGTPYIDILLTAADGNGGSATSTFRISLTAGAAGNGVETANNPGSVSVSADTAPTGGVYAAGTVLTATVSDIDGYNSAITYQWQMSADGVSGWTAISGATTHQLTLGLTESDQYVRVTAYYTDGGNILETPVSSPAIQVALQDHAGAVSISGTPASGYTLAATLTDSDGLIGASPTYTWKADGTTVQTGSSNAYTLTNNEGGKTISVEVSYTDDKGFATTVSATDPTPVQLGAVPPVPAVQTAEVTEAGGIANADSGSGASGNLLAGATDANAGDTFTFDSVRTGSVAGLGAPAQLDPLNPDYVVLDGTYGQLRVDLATGDYTYTLFDNSSAVQALRAGDTAYDAFNYTLKDSTDLTGTESLTITVHGADDAPTGTGLPASASVTEDVSTAVDLSALTLADVDGIGTDTYTLTIAAGTVGAILTATSGGGVTVGGSASGTLTLTGTLADLATFIGSATALHYTGKLNDDTSDTLSVTLQDVTTAGKPVVTLGAVAVDITPVNDAPTIDLDADGSSGAAGTAYTTAYTARSHVPVQVVDSDVTILDPDQIAGVSDTITMATVAITNGALDNLFGSNETLTATGPSIVTVDGEVRFTFANYDASDASTYLVVAGNGSAKLSFIGTGAWAQFEEALRTVFYDDANPNATAGARTITVTIQDGSITTSADGSSDTDNSLTAVASTTLTVIWAPVVDLDGEATANVDDRSYAITYTENGAPLAIAAPDASITDLDGNIKEVKVSLRSGDVNAPVGAADRLSISASMVTLLQSKGITTVVSGDNHTVTFTGNADGSVFQLGLRAVKYSSTSDSPAQALVRYVDVTTIDMQNHVGVGATTTINIVPVNDAPTAVADIHTVGEAGGLLNGTPGSSPVGNVFDNDTDPDLYQSSDPTQAETQTVTAVSFGASAGVVGSALAGQYGSLVLNPDGSYEYQVHDDNTAVQALRTSSDTLTEVFTYTMRDSGGATSSATLTVTITGANDTPVITVGVSDSDAADISETNATVATSGTLSVVDVDLTDSVTASVVSVVASGATSGLAADNATLRSMLHVDAGAIIDATHNNGTLNWNFNSATTQLVPDLAAYNNALFMWMGSHIGPMPVLANYTTSQPYNETFNYLAKGETLTLTYTVGVTDLANTSTTKSITINITGTNDVPVIGVIAQTDLNEQTDTAALTATIPVSFTDADLADVGHSASVTAVVATGQTAGLALDDAGLIALVTPGAVSKAAGGSAGSLSLGFSAPASALDYLADGQVLTLTYTVAIDDGDGAVVSQDFVVTVTGTNDVPLLSATDVTGAVSEAGGSGLLSDSGTIGFTDVDVTDLPTATFAVASISAVKADGLTPLVLSGAQQTAIGAAFSLAPDVANTHDGTIGWDYSIAETEVDFLAAGEQVTAVFTVTVNDGKGGVVDQDVTVTLNGTNDVPVVSAVDVAGELGEIGGAGTLTDTGSITFADLDLTDLPTASHVLKSLDALKHDGTTPLTLSAGQVAALTDAFSLAAGGANNHDGSIDWTYAIAEADVDFLGQGDSVTAVFTVTVDDGHGGLASQDVTVTLTGTNDAPILDLNGAVPGVDTSVMFNVRGDAVALFAQDESGNLNQLVLADKDDGDLIAGISLTLNPDDALDNLGEVVYESLFSTQGGGTFTADGYTLTIAGNGTADSPLTISGAGSVAAYEAALATLRYLNTNQNAFAGNRAIDVTVTDVGTTLPGNNAAPLSTSATLTVSVNWNPVVDLNGPGSQAGLPLDANVQRDYLASFVEKQPTITYIASNKATLFDQNGLISRVEVDLTNAQDGSAETLSVSANVISILAGLGITTTIAADKHSVLFESTDPAGRDVSQFQIGVRGVEYANSSNAPTEGVLREVTVVPFDTDGAKGVSATSYIGVQGVNVPPTLQDITAGSVSEVNQADSSAWTDAGLSGTLVGADEDLQTLTYGISGGTTGGSYTEGMVTYNVSKAGSYGTLYVDSASGDYLYVPDSTKVNALTAGEAQTESFTVTVWDGVAAAVTKTYTINLTGANDAPTVVGALSDDANEAGALFTRDLLAGAADADAGETATLTIVNVTYAVDGGGATSTAPAGFSLAGSTLSIDPSNPAFDSLAKGETTTVVVSYQVKDVQGATVAQTETVTITGTNDVPTVIALGTDSTGGVTEDSAVDALTGTLGTTGAIAFADIDLIDVHTGTVAADAANTLGGTLSLGAVTEDAAIEGGSIGWTYRVANSATQYLAAGETATEVFTVTLDDGQGGTVDQTVTVTITGTNDAPTVIALGTDSTGGVTEDSAVDALTGTLGTTGVIAFADIDLIDVHTATVAADAANTLGGTLSLGAVTEDAATEGGSIGWTYSVANSATQYLAAGETATEVFTVTLDDGEGGTVDQTVTVTITGTNDVPVLTTDDATARERGGAANALAGFDGVGNVLANDTDEDLIDTLNVVEITALTGVGSATAVAPDSTSSVGYIEVEGAYGKLRIGADGSYRYLINESNGDVQALRTTSDTLQDVFEYRVTDGIAQVASTLTITVEGANDAPTQIHLSNTALTEITGANAVTASVVDVGTLSTDDVDAGDSFTYDIIGGTQQFYFQIASVGGEPTLQLKAGVPLNAEFLSAYSVVVRSTDALGLSTFQTFVVNINDVNEFQVTTPVFDVESMDVGIAPNTVPENTAVDTFIGITASASDADASNNTITYSLVGSLAGAPYTANEFKIDAASGQISVAGPINREVGGETRTIYVKALSADGSSKIGTLQIFISDVNEFAVAAPTDINVAANVVTENAAIDTRVGITARAVDADATTNTVSYALVDADGAAYSGTEFEIDAVTGVVTVAGSIDRELGATRTIYVKATSADGSTANQSFTVAVTDLNDNAPVFTSGASGSVAENAPTSTVIYAASATDADATAAFNTVSYALKDGGDKALLNIDAATGDVTLKASADFETKAVYTFTVLGSDGNHVTERAVTVNVGNVDEAATGTLTVSGAAQQGGTLTASLSATDVDGAITGIAYQWQERVAGNWQNIPGATSATFELGNDQDVVGRVGRVVVTTTDALGGTTVFRSSAVTIANVNDTPTGEPAITGTLSQGQTLTASAGTLVDPDGLGVISYQWLAEGSVIGGATGSTLVLGEAQVGKAISVVASYTDGFGQAESVTSSRTAAVRNVNDAPTGSLGISGTPIQNATLSVVSTLADADGLGSVTYKWMSGSTQLGTGSSYTLGADDVGRSIHVVASWTDGHGTAESVSSVATSPVANVNDAPTGSLTVSGSAEEGQTLSAVSTLADADGLGVLAYQWLADGVAISGATGSSFVLTPGQVGKVISVQASWTDGQGTAEQVTSSATAKVNAVSTAGEGSAPTLGGGTAGDGNGDGIPDAIQSAVASSAVTVTTGGTTTSSYVTLVAGSDAGKVADGATNTVTSLSQTATAGYMPVNSEAPLGSVTFSASTGTVSGLEVFSLYVDNNLGVNGYWVTTPQGTLVNLASEAYGGRMVVEGDKLRLDFQIQDGSLLDKDGGADGSVAVDGAVGYVPLSLIAYTPDAPANHENAPIWD
ncbi:VCBS domain-containing protein [Zoogloea sp.]|uniref:VCBS domain-containing protein n=1 Tax=Zoogloea sp. TaxID=49181 RepID=UPI0035ADC127